MTEQEIINEINQFIVQNGSKAITANILRPILVAMAEQPNDLIGDLSALSTDDKDSLVNAINELAENLGSDGVTVLEGTQNPNITPPAEFSIGDFFRQLYLGETIGFYVYNGRDWALLSNGSVNSSKGIDIVTDNYVVKSADSTIVYTGTTTGRVITIPEASQALFRVITVVNKGIHPINLSEEVAITAPNDLQTQIAPLESWTVHSDGDKWWKTN